MDEAELLAATKEPDDAVSRAGSLSVVDGFYRNVGRRAPVLILLSAALMREAAELVLMHEYAHYVWDELLSSEDRQEFRRVWRRQRERGQLVSRYAEESPDEGFAEAVSHYVLRPETLRRRDAGAYAFLERCSAPEEREPADRG